MRSPCMLLAALSFTLGVNSLVSFQPYPVAKNGGVTFPVVLTPQDYPRPASRAYLLPTSSEAIPGNRVQMFLRCFMERSNFFGSTESELRDKWNEMPLKELPLEEIRKHLDKQLLNDLYDAARMTNVDWQLWYFLRRDGYFALLPDAQKMRSLATAMKTHVRAQIAAGEFDEAIRTLKSMFALARTFEAHPTLIGSLVGIAIATVAVGALEELIQQPGCPNLFWALTDLPTPFLSQRLAFDGERVMINTEFESLKNAADVVSDDAIFKKIARINQLLRTETKGDKESSSQKGEWQARLRARAGDAAEITAARKRIGAAGVEAAHVQVWSPLHVALIDEFVQYEIYLDEIGKWFNLPYWQAEPGMDEAEATIAKASTGPIVRGLVSKSPLLGFLPALVKVRGAAARLEQRLAYVRIMEGLRLYAYKNGGALPATLADMKLPVPLDPVSGKPFEYSLKNGVATLHGAPAQPGVELHNRYYEIRLRK